MGETMTLGMRLDSLISQVDNLSPTQLYGLIVAATVGLCFILLGSGNVQDVQIVSHPPKSMSNSKLDKGPQPRWHIFRWINYLFIAAFLWSVATFAVNASTYLHNDSQGVLLRFLFGWSVFLCYFFGFFGISFVHDITDDDHQTMVNTHPPSVVPSSTASSLRYVPSLVLTVPCHICVAPINYRTKVGPFWSMSSINPPRMRCKDDAKKRKAKKFFL